MRRLLATYRIQLHAGRRLADAIRLVPYLARLGVTHAYLSPVLRARRGTTHGYDVVDPTTLDPALGDEADLERLVRELRSHDMGLVLDIVPNHMATGADNPYWEDVLTHGRASRYAHWFDIDWSGASRGRVLLPVLGDRLAHVLGRGEIALRYAEGRFRVQYDEQSFPLDPRTLPLALEARGAATDDAAALAAVLEAARELPPRTVLAAERRHVEGEAIARRLAELCRRSPAVRHRLEQRAATLSAERLRAVLDAQPYRLAYWRRAAREINYRRFFTISHLVGLRQEDPRVFDATHARIFAWADRGWLDGVRVDHVDGLFDPRGYLERLRARLGTECAIFVEKILARDEPLREEWPVSGTTGYDFLAAVEDALLDPAGWAAIERAYRRFARRDEPFRLVALRAKRAILKGHLAADVSRLTRLLPRALGAGGAAHGALRIALVETIAHLPVYRTYLDDRPGAPHARDRARLERALHDASQAGRADDRALEILRAALLDARASAGTPRGDARLAFVGRFQQTSVPAAAKGVEDTAFYRYVPLASRAEVGCEPDAPLTDAVAALHDANRARAARWPGAMLCTSTHDTKRSADVRARLDVLSEIPERWARQVRRWRRWNRRHRRRVRGRTAPDAGTEYHFYQTLVGVWPLATSPEPPFARGDSWETFCARLDAYVEKAAREAKLRTSWVDPDAEFEAALHRFVQAALDPACSARFLAEVHAFVTAVARPGLWNAAARTLVHLTAPGVADIYQGDECWTWSLVDPDNRRPVDVAARDDRDCPPAARAAALHAAVDAHEDGRLKLMIVCAALHARRRTPQLFVGGAYHPLDVTGRFGRHVLAFQRSAGRTVAVTIAPRLTVALGGGRRAPVGDVWEDTAVRLPAETPPLVCQLTGRAASVMRDNGALLLPLARALDPLPVALLIGGD